MIEDADEHRFTDALDDVGARSVYGNECMMPAPRPWYRKLGDWLYPYLSQLGPEDQEGFAMGYARNRIVMLLDWKDRLRVLISGKVNLEMVHQTDVHLGKLKSTGTVCILPPWQKVR